MWGGEEEGNGQGLKSLTAPGEELAWAPLQGCTYINLSTIKAILIHDPGSKRTREWWEGWRGGVGRLRRLLRREGAGCQPCPRGWHFSKRLLQCPVWYNNRVTPLPSAPSPTNPGALGPPCLPSPHPQAAVPAMGRGLSPRERVQLGLEGPLTSRATRNPTANTRQGPQASPTCPWPLVPWQGGAGGAAHHNVAAVPRSGGSLGPRICGEAAHPVWLPQAALPPRGDAPRYSRSIRGDGGRGRRSPERIVHGPAPAPQVRAPVGHGRARGGVGEPRHCRRAGGWGQRECQAETGGGHPMPGPQAPPPPLAPPTSPRGPAPRQPRCTPSAFYLHRIQARRRRRPRG